MVFKLINFLVSSYYYLQYNGSEWINVGHYESESEMANISGNLLSWGTAAKTAPFSRNHTCNVQKSFPRL